MMNANALPVSFFFGANSKEGYCSLFNTLYSPYESGNHYILKGGPGSGKSTLMKKIAEKCEKDGYFTERGLCSADPNSVDVVLVPELNFSIFDGTAPHTFDPTMPGVTEHIVDLTVAWDKKYLASHREEITALTLENKLQHKKCAEYMSLASQLMINKSALCSEFCDRDKLSRFADRIARRDIPKKRSAGEGKEQIRFLSAITPDGIVTLHDTVVTLCEKMIAIDDKLGLCSQVIMDALADYAVNSGYDVYKCRCPLMPFTKSEHLIIPELKLAVFTDNSFHHAIDTENAFIHASRFYDKCEAQKYKERLRFLENAQKDMVDGAVRKMSLAKVSHDKLEQFYIKATDFDRVNEITEKFAL